MAQEKILIVEDELLVAEDIRGHLERLGYQTAGIAASAGDSLADIEQIRPDLVLMDIALPGGVDGIEAAEQIHQRFNLPVVFLTACTDAKTLERLRPTHAFGCIVKPFADHDLQSTLALALTKHQLECRLQARETALQEAYANLLTTFRELQVREHELRKVKGELQKREQFLASVFASIQDGLSILDSEMRIVRVNQTMEQWYAHAMPLVGKKCYEAYHQRKTPCDVCPTLQTLDTGQRAMEIVPKIGPNGQMAGWVAVHSFPLRDLATGKMQGVIEHVRDVTESKQAQIEKDRLITKLQEALNKVSILSGLLPICSNCKQIRDDRGYWHEVEAYIADHTDAEFTHALCPRCAQKLYPGYAAKAAQTGRPASPPAPKKKPSH